MRKNNVREIVTVLAENVKAENLISTADYVVSQSIVNSAVTICGKKIAAIPTRLLRICKSYQREASNVQKLIDEWDINKCDLLDVSYRDGYFYVIDGQHRLAAAKFKDVKSLPCVIREELTEKQEAIIFARQNRNIKKLYPYDTYKANIKCGDCSYPEVKVDMGIHKVCTKYHIEVKKMSKDTKGNKILRSLSEARRIVNTNGTDCFEWIIKMICSTNWENCSVSYSKYILRTLTNFYVEHKDNINKYNNIVKKIMNSNTPMQLIARSKADYSEYSAQSALNICFNKLIESPEYQAVKVITSAS